MKNLIYNARKIYSLSAPFPAKPKFSAGDEVFFGDTAFEYSPNEEELFVDFRSMLAGAEFSSIEKSALFSCKEEFPLYKKIFEKKFLPPNSQVLSPFHGWVDYFILPLGNSLCTAVNRKDLSVNLSDPLEIPPQKLLKFMKVAKNSKVLKGTVLAERRLQDNLTVLRAVSPIEGTVEDIDISSGDILIRRFEFEKSTVIPIPGRVTGTMEAGFCASMTVESRGFFVKLPSFHGKPASGEIFLLPSEIPPQEDALLIIDRKNIIAVLDKTLSMETVQWAREKGIKTLVCPSIDDDAKKAANEDSFDLSVAVLFFKGIKKIPSSMLAFFRDHRTKQASVSKIATEDFYTLFIPEKEEIREKYSVPFPGVPDEVLIGTGRHANKSGKVVNVQTHRFNAPSDIPTVEIELEENKETVYVHLNDLIF
ncbi:hypothetical protein JW890_05180 [candidate division WOR-3 bacterium]|nr:hypothetical protein [candidate division WOR-3 bacterium]